MGAKSILLVRAGGKDTTTRKEGTLRQSGTELLIKHSSSPLPPVCDDDAMQLCSENMLLHKVVNGSSSSGGGGRRRLSWVGALHHSRAGLSRVHPDAHRRCLGRPMPQSCSTPPGNYYIYTYTSTVEYGYLHKTDLSIKIS